MSVKTMLRDEIQNEIKEISKLGVGTDEHRIAVESATKLMDRLNDIEKSEQERADKHESQNIDYDLKVKQMKDEQKDRLVKNSIAVAGIVLPILVTIWGTKASFKFEEEGTITTTMGRGFINKLLPKK